MNKNNFTNNILKNYPFPVATKYKNFTKQENPKSKLLALLHTNECLLRYLNLLLLSIYSQEKILHCLRGKELFGIEFFNCSNSIKIFNLLMSHDLKTPLYKDIKDWVQNLENTCTYLREIHDYKHQNKSLNPLDTLCYIAKHVVPIIDIMNEEEIQSYLYICESALNTVLHNDYLEKYRLLYVAEKNNFRTILDCHGTSEFSQYEGDNFGKLLEGQIYIYDEENKTFLSLHPFIIYQDCYYCIRQNSKETKELFLFQYVSNNRLYYSGSKHEVALREHYQSFQNIWNEYKAGFNKKINVKEIWEFSFQKIEDQINKQKEIGIYNSYFSRKNNEVTLESFLNSSYPIFCITGDIGSGKTTLLLETSRKWSLKGEIVVFVSTLSDNIENFLDHYFDYSQFIQNFPKDSRLILIFDDINKNKFPEKLLSLITNFAHKYQKNIKIIVSLASIFHLHLKKHFKLSMFMPIEGKCPLIGSKLYHYNINQPSLFMGKNLYRSIANKKLGPVTPYDSFSQTVKGMLLNPSFIFIFIQALKNREVPYNLGIRDIMEGFVMQQINTNIQNRQTIDKIIDTNISSKKTSLSFDDITNTDDDEFIQNAMNFSLYATITKLEKKGILERYHFCGSTGENSGMSVPISLVRNYLHYRSYALSGKHADEMLIGYFSQIDKGDYSLLGIVYFALIRLADKQYFERFIKVIKDSGEYNSFARGITSHILLFKVACFQNIIGKGNEIDEFIDLLLCSNNHSCLCALGDVAVALYEQHQYISAAIIFKKLSEKIHDVIEEYDGISVLLLAARSYQKSGDLKKAQKLYKKSYKSIKKIQGTKQELHIYILLTKAHREMNDFEKVEFFLEKIQDFSQKITGTYSEASLYRELGYMEEKKGNFDVALGFFESEEKVYDLLGNENKIGYALENMARVHFLKKDMQKSIELLGEALSVFNDTGDNYKIASIKYAIGNIHQKTHNHKNAITYYLDALNVYEILEERNILVDLYMKISDIYESMEKLDDCNFYIEKSMHLLREIGDEQKLAKCFDKSGKLDFKLKQYKSALDKYFRALEIHKRTGNNIGLANTHNQLGILNFTQKKYEKANKHYSESLKTYQLIKDSRGIAEVYNNIVVVMAHTHKFKKALDTLLESRRLYQSIKDYKGIATTKGTEALIYKLDGNKKKSLECYLECAKMLQKINEKKLLGNVCNSIGLLYKEKGDFEDALGYFEKSIAIQEKIRDYVGLSASYNNIGLIYDAKNDYDNALDYYGKDLEISQKLNDPKGIATSYNNIAILHYNHKNYARSLWYLEKSIKLYQELEDERMVKKVKERIQYVKEKI